MKELYIIGNPIKQSLSPIMHNAALKKLGLENEYRYESLKIDNDGLESFIKKIRLGKIHGASVTIPFKESILQYADIITNEADQIQAGNTIYKKKGKVVVHNTDGYGLLKSLMESDVKIKDKNVLILGAGGAAKAILISLITKRIKDVYLINRTIERAGIISNIIKNEFNKEISIGSYDSLSDYMSNVNIIINTTSVGMKGISEDISLIPSSLIHKNLIIIDIVYNPVKTKLLIEAEKKGAKIINGIGMLVYQGAEQFEIFTGKKAPISVMKQAVSEVLK